MERTQINKMPGMSAYKLSHLISSLVFVKPNIRGQHRPDKIKKAVLRVLCDRYPNVWPGLKNIAAKASCSPAQARRVLRELENKDRLIVDISTSQPSPYLPCKTGESKKGGYPKDSAPQYFILDRKIFDTYQQQKMWEAWDKAHSSENSSETVSPLMGDGKPTHLRTEAHSSETESPLISASKQAGSPLTVSAEPTIFRTDHLEPTSIEPTIQPEADGWLAGRIAIIFSKAAGHIVGTTASEREQLAQAETKHGTLPILLAAYSYPERAQGIIDLARPVTRFLQELAPAIEVAQQNVVENTYPSEVRETVTGLVEEHGLAHIIRES